MPETQLPATPPAYSPPSLGLEPLLDRARRILSGAIAPGDYLQLTPAIRAGLELDRAFLQQRRGVDLAGEAMDRQVRERLLTGHCGGQYVAYLENASGVIVLASNDDVRILMRDLPEELTLPVLIGCPMHDDSM